MTEKKTQKLKKVLVLLLAMLMSFALFFTVACATPNDSTDDEDYTKVEHDEQELANGNFEFGTVNADLDDYPYTTTGWSRSTDRSAPSSAVTSGIVDTTPEAWEQLLMTLVENTTFESWAQKYYGLTDFSDDDLAEALKDKFVNPSVHEGAEGSKIYMLNNYNRDNVGKGTAQKLTASTTHTLSAGSYGKFSVWVKTGDLISTNANAPYANIRVSSTVAGVTQDEFAVDKILSDEWTNYQIYVKANDFADTTVKLVLGLGYGNGDTTLTKDFVEGTVYFDDASFEEVEESEFVSASATKIELKSSNSSEKISNQATKTAYYVDYTSENYFTSIASFDAVTGKTISNSGESKIPADASQSLTKADDGFTVNQTKNSTTTVVKSDSFVVAPKYYTMINFNLDMEYNKLQRTGVTVWLHDVDPANAENVKNQKVLDNVMLEEATDYTIVVKNNFVTGDRTFYLSFVYGPTDVLTTDDATLYVTGKYTVSNMTLQTGSYENNDDVIYSLVSKTENVNSFSVYAGSSTDYVEENNSDIYTFSVAASDKGTIETKPAVVANYTSVNDYANVSVKNENAGLINSNYLSAYGQAVSDALDHSGSDSVQPLMIYNESNTSFGYYRNNTSSITTNSSATVSAKVRVVGDAVAYVYLIDTTRGDNYLQPVKQTFKVGDKEYSNELFIRVTADMMESDGWVTVKFFVEAGKTTINYRIELWNGERTTEGQTAQGSKGYVFFNDVEVGDSFVTSEVISSAKAGTLVGFEDVMLENDEIVNYKQQLNENEIKWNEEYPDEQISYSQTAAWAQDKSGKLVIASFIAIDPIENDPYASEEDDDHDHEEETSTGCNSADAGTVALSISSIIIALAIIAAVIAIIVKAIVRKRKVNKSDAKSHYKVTSRNKTNKAIREKAEAKRLEELEKVDEEVEEEPEETTEYTYGEVLEDFGDDMDAEEETSEETSDDENKE